MIPFQVKHGASKSYASDQIYCSLELTIYIMSTAHTIHTVG